MIGSFMLHFTVQWTLFQPAARTVFYSAYIVYCIVNGSKRWGGMFKFRVSDM